jgi:hypothetical protein
MSLEYLVRGHMCDGLQEFQRQSNASCIPRIKANGTVAACDDQNEIAITHCPFCGTALTGSAELDCGQQFCNCTEDEHADRDY